MKYFIIAVFIIGISTIWLIINQKIDHAIVASLGEEIESVSINHSNSEIIWNEFSDPIALRDYCSMQFITASEKNEDSCSLTVESSEQAKLFTDALWEIWSGRLRRAKEKLELFQQEETWSLWGKIGLLELAFYTGNQKELKLLLNQFKEDFLSPQHDMFAQSYDYYEMLHAKVDLNWINLAEKLEKYTPERIAANPDFFLFQANVFFVNGQRKELEELLNQANIEVKETPHYVHSLVYLAILKADEEVLDFVKKNVIADWPSNTGIVFEIAQLELVEDNPTVQRVAIERFLDLARLSRNNPGFLLDIMDTLMSFHKFDEAGQVFKYIDVDPIDLDDFVLFKVILAWNYVYMGDYEKAAYEIELALKSAPKDLSANWLKVLLTKKLERPDLAINALNILFIANPYNQSYRNQITHFRDKYKTPELESLYRRMVEHH